MNTGKKTKILSFDIDMTLFDDDAGVIPESALKAIDAVRDRCYIVLSTGRNLSLEVNQRFFDMVNPDACVHSNGTQVHIGRERIYLHLFEKDIIKRVVEFADAHDLCVCTLVNNIQYSTRPEKMTKLLPILHGESRPKWGKIENIINEPVMTFGLAGDEKDAQLLREAFPELKVKLVIGETWFDIMDPEIDKAHGMGILLDHFGLTMKDVIAFGDSMNDYELMEAAGTAVAMGNAIPEIKKIADLVTTDVDKDGVANAIKKLCY